MGAMWAAGRCPAALPGDESQTKIIGKLVSREYDDMRGGETMQGASFRACFLLAILSLPAGNDPPPKRTAAPTPGDGIQ
jgi:hypothetical protein